LLVFHLQAAVAVLEALAVEEHPAMVWLVDQEAEHPTHPKSVVLEFQAKAMLAESFTVAVVALEL
jgi:hypothetical protein